MTVSQGLIGRACTYRSTPHPNIVETLAGYASRMALRFAGPVALITVIPFGKGSLRDQIHDLSAYSVAGILLLYMLFVRKLVPYFSPEFYTTTWFMAGLLVVAVALHQVGSINTVGVVLLSFVLGGAWFILFIKNVDLLVAHLHQHPAGSSADV